MKVWNYVFGSAQSLQNSLDGALGSEPTDNFIWLEKSVTCTKVFILRKLDSRKTPALKISLGEVDQAISPKFK